MDKYISAGMKFRIKKFRYGTPAYTGPLRELVYKNTRLQLCTLVWYGYETSHQGKMYL
jgi:hypothetical protein